MEINFYLNSSPDLSGDKPIVVTFTTNGIRFRSSTGYKIADAKWDKTAQRVRRGAVNAAGMPYNIINAGLDKMRAHFGAIDDVSKRYTKDDLAEAYNTYRGGLTTGKGKPKTYAGVGTVKQTMLKFTVEQGQLNGWKEATFKKFKTLENHIEAYKPGLKMADLNEDILNGFVAYLIGKKFNNNYIRKMSKILSWFLRWTSRKGICPISDFTPLAPKLKVPEKPVIFLEWDELLTVKDFAIPTGKHYLERVRDIFCFCCFTGLRYSDAQNLKRADIKGGNHIDITTVKTSDKLTIPLNQYSKAILNKYVGAGLDKGRALPTISNQKANTYLKELCKLCGIDQPITIVEFRGSKRSESVRPKWELIGTHCGRRTFICAAIEMNIPIPTIMDITGHSDYNAMKPYIAIASRSKQEAMDKFDKRL